MLGMVTSVTKGQRGIEKAEKKPGTIITGTVEAVMGEGNE